MSTMNRACDVFAGPTTSTSVYAKIGSVGFKENVTVKFKETVSGVLYYYIQYSTKTDLKCGYVPASALTLTESNVSAFTPSASTRYVGVTSQTEYGPGATYFDAIPLPAGKVVTYLGKKETNNYAFISFTAEGKTYRAYINSANLRTAAVASPTNVEKMCQIAELELGCVGRKFWDWYGEGDVAWCAIFVSWCANYAGILTTASTANMPYVFRAMSVYSMRQFYNNSKRYVKADSHVPKRGDIAFFTADNHVGVVVAVSGNQVKLVEGNCSGQVKTYTYNKVGSEYVMSGISNHVVGFGKNST